MRAKYFLIVLISATIFISCKDYDNYDPIFYVGCHIKYEIQSDGSSYLEKHKEDIKNIKMKMVSPSSELYNKLEYDSRSDALVVSITPISHATGKTNFEEDYIFEIVFPESMQSRKDVIKVQYRNIKHIRSFVYYVNGIECKPIENNNTRTITIKVS